MTEDMDKRTEYKVYSLIEHGPKIPKGQSSSTNVKAYEDAQLDNGGKSTSCTPFLRLPTVEEKDSIFKTLDLLTTTAGPNRRNAYHVDNLRFLDRWLQMRRTIAPTHTITPGQDFLPGVVGDYTLWR